MPNTKSAKTTQCYNLVEFDGPPVGGLKAYQVLDENGVVAGYLNTDGTPLTAPTQTPIPFHIIEENVALPEPPPPPEPVAEPKSTPQTQPQAQVGKEAHTQTQSAKK